LWMDRYGWPGNVRELQHAIEHTTIMGTSELISAADLRRAVGSAAESSIAPSTTRYHEAVDQARRQVILQALDHAGGVYTQAAKLLGLHPVHLHRLMRTLAIQKEAGSRLKRAGA
jgi:DNA-binding NtrC family response regulator